MPASKTITDRHVVARAAARARARAAVRRAERGAQPQQARSCIAGTKTARKVCGDALPAEAVEQRAHRDQRQSGRRTGDVAARADAEERAAAERPQPPSRRRAEDDGARMRREMAMVESYATEDDLRRAFQRTHRPAASER